MRLLAWCVVFAGLACAQPMPCQPTLFDTARYPPLASAALIFGTVDARVVVGENGTVKSAAYTGHSLLVPAVQSAMARSQLSGTCAGEYHLIYRFVLGSKLREQSVQFNPPNEFVLIAPPMTVEPSLETCSPRWFEVPHYPRLALEARIQGSASAQVSIGSDGSVKAGAVQAHPLLAAAIKDALARSKLAAECAGREYRLTYRFEIRGKPTCEAAELMTFSAPAIFLIRSSPMCTMID